MFYSKTFCDLTKYFKPKKFSLRFFGLQIKVIFTHFEYYQTILNIVLPTISIEHE